jgi:dUTP pyrophosphatase
MTRVDPQLFTRRLVAPITAAAMQVRVRIQHVGAIRVPSPSYQTSGSAGLDLCAALPEPVRLAPGERRLIPAGLRLELPEGFEGQVRPRSGLALRHGLTVLNSPGTIDSDYRGELGILLINLGSEAVEIAPLQRIAQLVIAPVSLAQLEVVTSLSETGRAAGGYGSTGT